MFVTPSAQQSALPQLFDECADLCGRNRHRRRELGLSQAMRHRTMALPKERQFDLRQIVPLGASRQRAPPLTNATGQPLEDFQPARSGMPSTGFPGAGGGW
jgi:hypothetical protein